MSADNHSFKETLNLPQTDFPIRANLAQVEPQYLAQWEKDGIYSKIQAQQASRSPAYTLHDGPPYPNGNIHLGHALNKVLKDIIVRFRGMTGYKSMFIPGWDCHGLPIETQLIKDLQKQKINHKAHDISWFRSRCAEFAMGYVTLQKQEFQRLGIFGEWDQAYLTLNSEYEAAVIRVFGELLNQGVIYRGRKPIHWSTACETALAEAELEYQDTHKSPSIYVRFRIETPSEALAKLLGDQPASLLVWTTTPWTLPANVAVAAHPDFEYLVAKTDTDTFVFASALKEKLSQLLEHPFTVIGAIRGAQLAGTQSLHPFYDRTSDVVLATYVTEEDGTGFVHIAPGHGQEDYQVGLRYNLPVIMPVDTKGRFTAEVPEWEGKQVFEANPLICETMSHKGTLVKQVMITHSYPYCWRSKTPVIFRATDQWFVAMDTVTKSGKTIREMALDTIPSVGWVPAWGQNRITAMIQNRPDWCISRQRSWGIPIPVLRCAQCGEIHAAGAINDKIAEVVRAHGGNAWFTEPAETFLPEEFHCACGSVVMHKESDILDVWFESGASFASVLNGDPLRFPAQLYLEGSDQHRGWFQSSLLLALGTRHQASYESVLTHGFIVDEKGKKMSKSLGNVVHPQDVISEHGADVLRWWVASSDFKDDISVSKSILNQARDSFAKVRNTMRFLLSNLYDFKAADALPYAQLQELDRWVLMQLYTLVDEVKAAYGAFNFHLVVAKIHDFCSVTLSALYLDMVKDRLYCDLPGSPTRLSTQTALYTIFDTVVRLIAPILPFTAEDAYRYFDAPDKLESIHLSAFPVLPADYHQPGLAAKWDLLLKWRARIYQEMEPLKAQKVISNFLTAAVEVTIDQPMEFSDWEAFLIVSRVDVTVRKEFSVRVRPAEGEKCQRCWKVKPVAGHLCERCGAAVATLNAV